MDVAPILSVKEAPSILVGVKKIYSKPYDSSINLTTS